MVRLVKCIVLFVIADTVMAMINNTEIEARNEIEGQPGETRRKNKKKKKERSTSSSDNHVSADSGNESLELTDSSASTSDSKGKNKEDRPQSSLERRGWKKWHRKCTQCPEDMRKKWRDPTINWICGAFQRARRSFKSVCMMHYRNCQDGTMFTKIHDHRCANNSEISPHGDHFFYEYRVVMRDDLTDSKTVSDSTHEEYNSSY